MDNVKLIVMDLQNDLLHDCRNITVNMIESLRKNTIDVMSTVLDELKDNDVIYDYRNSVEFSPNRSAINTFIKYIDGDDIVLYETVYLTPEPQICVVDIDFKWE